jgi:hypothetical protein
MKIAKRQADFKRILYQTAQRAGEQQEHIEPELEANNC